MVKFARHLKHTCNTPATHLQHTLYARGGGIARVKWWNSLDSSTLQRLKYIGVCYEYLIYNMNEYVTKTVYECVTNTLCMNEYATIPDVWMSMLQIPYIIKCEWEYVSNTLYPSGGGFARLKYPSLIDATMRAPAACVYSSVLQVCCRCVTDMLQVCCRCVAVCCHSFDRTLLAASHM